VKDISGKDFANLLEKKGWELRRRREVIMFTPKRETPLKIGLLRHLMKVAGIDESEFVT